MPITPCWHCGAQPVRQVKTFIGVEWAALHCCTTGSYSPHEENTIDSWNRQQKALALLRAVEWFQGHGTYLTAMAFECGWDAKIDAHSGHGVSLPDALLNLIERIDQA